MSAPRSPGVPDDRFTGLLLEVATPDVLRNNVFRLVGLPTDAPRRDLQREGQRLALVARLEDDTEAAERVDAALQRLRDPVQRLVDELLWLWPDEVAGAADHNAIIRQVQELTEGGDGGDGDDRTGAQARGRAARQALQDMAGSLRAPETVTYMSHRALELGDPRLSVPDVGDLLAQAQVVMPVVLLREAAQSLRGERRDEARHWVRAVTGSGTDREVLRLALETVFGPVIGPVRSAAQDLEADNTDPRAGADAASKLLDRATGGECAILTLLDADDPFRSGVIDDVVRAVNTNAVRFYNDGGDPELTLHVLRRASELEPGAVAAELLGQNIEVIEENLRTERMLSRAGIGQKPTGRQRVRPSDACWFCSKRVATGEPGRVTMRKGTAKREIELLRCGLCEMEHSQRQSRADKAGCVVYTLYFLATLPLIVWLAVAWWDDMTNAANFGAAAEFPAGLVAIALALWLVPPTCVLAVGNLRKQAKWRLRSHPEVVHLLSWGWHIENTL